MGADLVGWELNEQGREDEESSMGLPVFVPMESARRAQWVAAIPETVANLIARGFHVMVQAGAGEHAGFDDAGYADAGATLVGATEGWSRGHIILKTLPLGPNTELGRHEVFALRQGATVIGLDDPASDPDLVLELARRRATMIALNRMPESRGLARDETQTAQATAAGTRAALLAAYHLSRFIARTTAHGAGVISARVVILGGDADGLAALRTLGCLGAFVEVLDHRPGLRGAVEAASGAFAELPQPAVTLLNGGDRPFERPATKDPRKKVIRGYLGDCDAVVITALMPATEHHPLVGLADFGYMRRGTVVVDMVAGTGLGCEISLPGKVSSHDGITVVGCDAVEPHLLRHASSCYARRVESFLNHISDGRSVMLDDNDAVVRAVLLMRGGIAFGSKSPGHRKPGNKEAGPPKRPPPPPTAADKTNPILKVVADSSEFWTKRRS